MKMPDLMADMAIEDGSRWFAIGCVKYETEVVVSVVVAVCVGVCAAAISNLNLVHWPLSKIGLTRENSYSSEWYSAFYRNRCFVVLHFKDKRRLYGWPTEWSSDPERGHFRVTDAQWLTENQIPRSETAQLTAKQRQPLEVLIPVQSIEMVEFVNTARTSKWRQVWQKSRRILPKA